MFKYKFLILILMIMKSLNYSEAKDGNDEVDSWLCMTGCDLSNKPRLYDTYTKYENDMKNKGITTNKTDFIKLKLCCPNMGEIFEDYVVARKGGNLKECYSKNDFTTIIELYPKFTETKADYLIRIKFKSKYKESKIDEDEFFIGLRSLYPIFGETYYEYCIRIQKMSLFPMNKKSFILYQAFYPNLGVQYVEFYCTMTMLNLKSDSFKNLNLKIYPEDIYNAIKNTFPKPFESEKQFKDRMISNKDFDFIYHPFFAKRMYPKMSETNDEFCNRISSIFVDKNDPEILSDNKDFNFVNKNDPEILSDYKDFNFVNKNDPEILSDYKDFNCLKPISHQMFMNYKRNYPQFLLKYKEIEFEKINEDILYNKVVNQINEFSISNYSTEKEDPNLVKFLMENNSDYIHNKNLAETMIDITAFKSLVRRLPNTYENYKLYQQRMITIGADTLDEEDFEDLKKIYIRQCEHYDAYEKRMIQISINPTSKLFALNFKKTVPREYEENMSVQYYELMEKIDEELKEYSIFEYKSTQLPFSNDDDLNEKQELYSEPDKGYHYIKAFSVLSNKVFKLTLPIPLENYHKYSNRLESKKEFVFEEYMLSFMKPLTKDEFSDLKLRLPKLGETPYEYENRLQSVYGITPAIDSHYHHIFHLIKHSQIQPADDYEGYQKRFKKLEINKKMHLRQLGISLLQNTEFTLIKKYLPTTNINDYSEYLKDKNKSYENIQYILDVNDYDDFVRVLPKYYDTLEEYNELMKNRYLDQVSKDYFEVFKKMHPHFLDENDFEKYTSRVNSYIDRESEYIKEHLLKFGLSELKKIEFDILTSRIPRPFELIETYRVRLPDISIEHDDYERFKRIYPKVSSTNTEYSVIMESMGIPVPKNSFKIYKNQLPNVNDKETYDEYHTKISKEQSFFMTKEEYRLWFLRLPKAPERYSNHIQRMTTLSNESTNVVKPLEKHEFHDLKNLFSIPYETYQEHCFRLKEYNLKELTKDQFIKEKSYRVLVGEIYSSHVDRILQLFREQYIGDCGSKKQKIIQEHGIESLIQENFVEHVLSYPFTYDTFEKFKSRQNNIIFSFEPNPVNTLTWYSNMKKILPQLGENINYFKKRVINYNLSFPEITQTQFNQHKQALPNLGESSRTFYSRIEHTFSDDKLIMEYKKMWNHFVEVSPNFFINYSTYYAKVNKYAEPLSKVEFKLFKKHLPELQNSFLEYNLNITLMDFAKIEKETFIKLKIFYPRIYHISYDNYILDIELKYGKEADDYRGVIDALKLSSDEFNTYKIIFPRLSDINYGFYLKRMHSVVNNICVAFTEKKFNVVRKVNFPLPSDNYKQHVSKMDYLDIDPIPYDVFCFLKRLYPYLLEEKYYSYTVSEVYKELKGVNYLDNKYKLHMDNEIIAKIIQRSNPYIELQNKISDLTNHIMINGDEFNQFMIHIPEVFKPYSNFNANLKRSNDLNYSDVVDVSVIMDEELFESFKKAYFLSINETYLEYETRMKSLKLTAVPRIIFYYFKSIYPHLLNNYTFYKEYNSIYENVELRNTEVYIKTKITSLGYKLLTENEYIIFQKYIPRIFDSNINYLKCIDDVMPIIFNHDDFDSIKTAYYPRLSENFDNFKARMKSLGLGNMEYKAFKSFKLVYPNPTTSTVYSDYKTAFETRNNHNGEATIGIRHIMTEEEFDNDLIQDFPKLFEDWEDFLERRLNSSPKDKKNRLINDNGIFSKNLFNDMKKVFYPKFGQNIVSFLTINNNLKLNNNTPKWTEYFKNVIKLYPIFFESHVNYNDRLEGKPLEYLKLNEKMFYTFFEILPFPYEAYSQYNKRNAGSPYLLSEEEFTYFRQVFPLISETYTEYQARFKYKLCIAFLKEEIFLLFQLLFPKINEAYDDYKSHFDYSLTQSDTKTKKDMSFLVKYMNVENTASTSEKKNLAMTYEEFLVFKLSLPIPKEIYKDYILRINELGSLINPEDSSNKVKPEILPPDLFKDLQNYYKINFNDHNTDYEQNMEKQNAFYKTIVTSKNHESLEKWPWYVDTISMRHRKKGNEILPSTLYTW